MIRTSFCLGLGLLALTACGTPYEQCLNRAGSELTRLENERAERQLNLQRGYALVMRPRAIEMCSNEETGAVFACSGFFGAFDEEPEPINRAIEARRIAVLDDRIAQARPRAAAGQAACRAQFPQG